MNVNKRRIPEFASMAEEAAFWDHNDATDFAADLQPVEVAVAEKLSTGITVRLQPQDLEILRKKAREQGIGPSSLVRMWIKRLLKDDNHGPASHSG